MAEDGGDMETLLDTLAQQYAATAPSIASPSKRLAEIAVDDVAPWHAKRRKRQGNAQEDNLQAPAPDSFDEGEDVDAVLALPVEAPEDGVDSYEGSDIDEVELRDALGHFVDVHHEANNAGSEAAVVTAASEDQNVLSDLVPTSDIGVETALFDEQLAENDLDGLCVGMDVYCGVEEDLGVEALDACANEVANSNLLDTGELVTNSGIDPESKGTDLGTGDAVIHDVSQAGVEPELAATADIQLDVEEGMEVEPELAATADIQLDVEDGACEDEEARLAEIFAAEFGSLRKPEKDLNKGSDISQDADIATREKTESDEKLLAEEAMQAMLCGDSAKYEELNKKLVDMQAAKARLAERKLPPKVASVPAPDTDAVVGFFDKDGKEICIDFKFGRCIREFCCFSHGDAPPPQLSLHTANGNGTADLGGGEFLHEFEALREIATFTSAGLSNQELEVKVLDSYGLVVEDCPRYTSFAEPIFPFGIMSDLLQAGFSAPTQIQQYTWPLALQMQDIIGVAATGSGKTLAFLLPAFSHILQHSLPASAPTLLVLAPTRELAVQIDTEAKRFGGRSGLRTVCCYGGAPKHMQSSELRVGVHGVIGTPGRLNDFLDSGELNVQYVTKLVVDEGDRMLDMGFEPQIRSIIKRIPEQRQTLFFTATWPNEIQRVASEFLRHAFRIQIGQVDELTGNQDITQVVKICRGKTKPQMLIAALRQAGVADRMNFFAKALVFCNTKRLCDSLAQQLSSCGVPCNTIHGDKDQRQREFAINDLKTGRSKLLVATDVAARGLDLRGVTLVINYDAPGGTEDYVHRIGRTGRAGQKGFAVSLISDRDFWILPGIVQVMRRTGQYVSPQVEQLAQNPIPYRGGRGVSRFENSHLPTKLVPKLSVVSSPLCDGSQSRETDTSVASPVLPEAAVSNPVKPVGAMTSNNVEICD